MADNFDKTTVELAKAFMAGHHANLQQQQQPSQDMMATSDLSTSTMLQFAKSARGKALMKELMRGVKMPTRPAHWTK